MKTSISKVQFDKLAAIINDSFGIADESGKVLYSVPEKLWEDGQIDFTCEAEENFFSKDGFCFYRCRPKENILYIFKRRDTDVTCTERVLRLVAYTLSVAETEGKDPTTFYRKLLTSGQQGVSPTEIKEYEISKVLGYVALAVSFEVREDTGDGELVKELLINVFSGDRGYFTIEMTPGKFAVICPVKSEEEVSDIKSTAELVNDTATTEIMISLKVSCGTLKNRLSELNESYEEALKAAEIGTLFELSSGCYCYDDLGVHRLIYEMKTDTCIQFLKETLGNDFFRDKNGPELLSSLKVFLNKNMNISEASKALYIHRNTLLYRMDKFKKLSGLDVTDFEDGVKVRIALMIIKFLEKTAPEELLKYIAFYRKK